MAPNCWAMAWKARWGVDPPLAMAAMQALTLPGSMECKVLQYLTMAPNCWAMAWKARWGVDPPLAMAVMQAFTLPGPGRFGSFRPLGEWYKLSLEMYLIKGHDKPC
jgi:hypothetical protein